MPAAKVAPALGAAPTKASVTRPTRTRRAATTTTDTDSLAVNFERVLKVGQPKATTTTTTSKSSAQPPAKRVASVSKATKSITSVKSTKTAETKPTQTNPALAARRKVDPTPAASSSKQALSSRPAAAPRVTVSSATLPKGKAPMVEDAAQKLPWIQAGSFTSRERAAAAQAAIREGGRVLTDASKLGFKHGSASSTPASISSASVEEALEGAMAGLTVVRELFGASSVAQRTSIEKGAMNLVMQCLLVDMHKHAARMLLGARASILSLYAHEPVTADQSLPQASSSKVKAGEVISASDLCAMTAFPQPSAEVDDQVLSLICMFTLSSWCCHTALNTVNPSTIQKVLPMAFGSLADPLSPANVATKLPASNVNAIAVVTYRHLSTLSMSVGSDAWLHVRRIVAFLLALCVSSNPAKPNPPDKLWESVERTSNTYLKERDGDQPRRDIAAFIDDTVNIVERLCATRGEARSWWFPKSWVAVADIWIGLGRTLGDSAIIDNALGAITAGVTISSPATTSSTQPQSSSKVDNPRAQLAGIIGAFSKALLELETLSKQESPAADALQILLSSVDTNSIVAPICSLDDADVNAPAATNALRSVERLRRVVTKLLGRAATVSICRSWLVTLFNSTEEVMTGVTAPKLVQLVSRDCLPAIVDTADQLVRVWDLVKNSNAAVDLLDRARSAWQQAGQHLDFPIRIQYGAFLVQSAHSAAYRLTKTNDPHLALAFARRACDWTIDMRTMIPSDCAPIPSWDLTESALPKRFEILGYCCDDKVPVALAAFCDGLANLPAAMMIKIEEGAKSQAPKKLLAGDGDISNLLKRLSSLLTGAEVAEVDLTVQFKASMDQRQVGPVVRGAIGEVVVDAILHAQFRPHVQSTIVSLCDYLLEIYEAPIYPVRRMRVLLRLMNLIVATGAIPERYNALSDEVKALVTESNLGDDTQLESSKFEFRASALILNALNQYHSDPAAAAAVASLGSEAVEAIRAVVLPPIRGQFPAATGKRAVSSAAKSPAAKVAPGRTATTRPAAAPSRSSRVATKAPVTTKPRSAAVSKIPTPCEAVPAVIDDIEQLSQLLSSLASLLGLLGHVLPRLETLKVLRALLRHDERAQSSFIQTSGHLATEYGRLGKYSRAAQIFTQAIKAASDSSTIVSHGVRADLHLRYSRFLATTGSVKQACEQYHAAGRLVTETPTVSTGGTYASRYLESCAASERVALAHEALAAIKLAEPDVTAAIESLNTAYRLWSNAAAGISRLAATSTTMASEAPEQQLQAIEDSSPITAQSVPATKKLSKDFCLTGKHLGGLQWYYAMAVFDATLDLIAALAQRGTVKECEYYLNQARGMAPSVRSSALDARVAAQTAALDTRKTKFEESAKSLQLAADSLAVEDGPDAIELRRLRGELYSRQQAAPEADDLFTTAIEALVGLDAEYNAFEAQTTSPSKDTKTPVKEPVLPHSLGKLLRQRAWLLREAGEIAESDNVLRQLDLVPKVAGDKPEQLYLDARMAMSSAFDHFKTDLFMSSLTESTIAMTMASPDKRPKERLSTRNGAHLLLEKAVEAFRITLANYSQTGRVEDIRQACVSLAVLGAFQTSLGQGSATTTALTAGLLASISSLSLHRELLPAIHSKFPDPEADDLKWPRLEPEIDVDDENLSYWKDIKARHAASDFLQTKYDLSKLPKTWSVVSITVTDDRNTMLVSRHQNGFEPLVFCIPLDRQGRREGEEESELFTFDAGINELKAIMDGNDQSIGSIRSAISLEERKAWWVDRYALDTRLGELLATVEFCWLGAFKTVLNPRPKYDPAAFATFRDRLDHIFQTALTSAGSDMRRGGGVRLNDTLLSCFATLSSKCKDEEIEDLVYFVLDQYQFNGVAVALAELDFDQIGVDVKSALSDLELATAADETGSQEHLLLALDKNVQGIPWESLPILRGRAVSRIPSLPFLLDQVALGNHLGTEIGHRTVNPTKTRFFMNPGGDLVGTQNRFEERLSALEKKGWSGLRSRAPTETEMQDALQESDLVMYFGHGGGEEYIRGYKVRALRRCAVTMLWGCSSGRLQDQGDFDRTGTPYDYVLAGSPCLVANLWDVTDKDIDRVTEVVMDHLGLKAEHVGPGAAKVAKPMTVVQAVSAARSTAKLQYLTGAATVVYGIPVYIQ